MNKKFLLKAAALMPDLTHQNVTLQDNKVLDQGESVVYDFGDHYVGTVTIAFGWAGSPQDAPALVKIKFSEIAYEVDEDTSDYKGWISKSWIQEELVHIDALPCKLKLKRRYAFRYVKIEAVALSQKYSLIINKLVADTVTSAPEFVPTVGNTPLEKQIDKIALRTMRECMQYEFEDGPKRDRRLWLGDLRLQAITNYCTFKHNDLVKRCLYLFAGTADKNGNISACVFTKPKVLPDDTYMFDYSLLFIPTLLDYLNATGDKQTATELLPLALKQLDLAKAQFDGDVVRDSDKLGWCFLDWNLALNKQCGAQAVYIYCAKAAAKLCERLDKDNKAIKLDIEAKTKAAIDTFYDKQKGLFVSGADKQVSYASNIWMSLAHVFGEKERAELLDRLKNYDDAVKLVTPYAYHHYIQALVECRKSIDAHEIILSYWGKMTELGADTFYELFNPENPDESPYGSRAANSYCHAWSCTPSYFLRKYF